MGNIVLLDDLTINKIAAGEVIERPASVVKEMIENSIDAGADKIIVEIKNGGISQIKITDNGKGIEKDDLEMAFERHATSKIRSAKDLDTVKSMGFRGEALASVAAIAHVELVSKTSLQDVGYKVCVEAGDVLQKEETGCSNGTTITVTNLFFNTPVRYKFLKKDYTEFGYIEDVVTRIALVNPNIAIKLINSGKVIIQTPGNGDLKTVVYSIYGKDVSEAILNVNYESEGIKVSGVIGKPEIARSNRSNQLFFVNKRYIKDKTLTAATEQAYKGLIPIGKFGFAILNLDMNPAKVDVNVHPAKLEVRFQEENKVFQAIYHSIKDTLLKGDLVANTEKKIDNEQTKKINPREKTFEQRLAEKLQEKESQKANKGLFAFGRQNKQIEEYNNRESQIKTNNIIEDLYKSKKEEPKVEENLMDTSDVLEELKKMQSDIEKDIKVTTAVEQESTVIPVKEEISDNKEDINLDADELRKKVESVLSNAKQIKEKNNKILEEEYDPLKDIIKEKKLTNIDLDSNSYTYTNTKDEIINNTDEEISEEISINKEEIINEQKNEEIKENEEKLEYIKEKIDQLKENPKVITEDFKEMYAKLFGTVPKTEEDIKQEQEQEELKKKTSATDIITDNMTLFEQEEEFKIPQYRFIGIAFNTYIIIEMKNEMYILDQHAAHERIMYEKVKENYYSETKKDSQMLLLPDVITLTHKEMDIAKDNMEMFEKAGFTLEEFGENTIKLEGCPTICIDLDTKELFLETLDEINTVARTAKQEKEEKFIATVACKAAVKAHMVLSKEEVDSLMQKLLRLPNPFTCPHGRPTAIKMTKYDIERKFARK